MRKRKDANIRNKVSYININKNKKKQTKKNKKSTQRKLCDDVSGNRGGVIAAEILRGPQEIQGSPETLRRQGRD